MNLIALIVVPLIAGFFLYRLNYKIPEVSPELKTFLNMVTLAASAVLILQAVGMN